MEEMRKQNKFGVMLLVPERVWGKHRSVLLCEQLLKENSSWSSYLTEGQTQENQRLSIAYPAFQRELET